MPCHAMPYICLTFRFRNNTLQFTQHTNTSNTYTPHSLHTAWSHTIRNDTICDPSWSTHRIISFRSVLFIRSIAFVLRLYYLFIIYYSYLNLNFSRVIFLIIKSINQRNESIVFCVASQLLCVHFQILENNRQQRKKHLFIEWFEYLSVKVKNKKENKISNTHTHAHKNKGNGSFFFLSSTSSSSFCFFCQVGVDEIVQNPLA